MFNEQLFSESRRRLVSDLDASVQDTNTQHRQPLKERPLLLCLDRESESTDILGRIRMRIVATKECCRRILADVILEDMGTPRVFVEEL